MSQHFKSVNRSAGTLAGEVVSLLLWVTRRLFWLLLRRPLIDIVLLMLALWLITGFIGRLLAPQPVLYRPAAVFEGR
jgi:hypothetical protein